MARSDYLDPRWQKKRLETLARYDFTCGVCNDSSSELHVHHLLYEKGKKLWEVEDAYLIAVCRTCHNDLEDTRRDILEIMAGCPTYYLAELHGALCAILDWPCPSDGWNQWLEYAQQIRRDRWEQLKKEHDTLMDAIS